MRVRINIRTGNYRTSDLLFRETDSFLNRARRTESRYTADFYASSVEAINRRINEIGSPRFPNIRDDRALFLGMDGREKKCGLLLFGQIYS